MSGKASVYAQQRLDDKWIWWITAPNHATLARSARSYATERAAITAAMAVAALGSIEVDERNLS